jgi:CheY-like chemotaxis protein
VDAPAEEAEPSLQPATPGAQGTVLLVEDEVSLRELAAEMLDIMGYSVLAAGSGPEALAVAEAHGGRIDLLLTDVVMPGMNGRELADRLLAVRPETRVVFMSGYTAGTRGLHGLLNAGTLLLEKPFTQSRLASMVREALEPGNQPPDAVATRETAGSPRA